MNSLITQYLKHFSGYDGYEIDSTGQRYYINLADGSPPMNEDYKFTYIIPDSMWDNIIWDDNKSDIYNMLSPIHTYIHKKFEEDKTELNGMCFQIGMYLNRIRQAQKSADDSYKYDKYPATPYITESYIVQSSRYDINKDSIDAAIKQMEWVLEHHTEHFHLLKNVFQVCI